MFLGQKRRLRLKELEFELQKKRWEGEYQIYNEVLKQKETGFSQWKTYEHEWHVKKETAAVELAKLELAIQNKSKELALASEHEGKYLKQMEYSYNVSLQHRDNLIQSLQEMIKTLLTKMPSVDIKEITPTINVNK